MNVSTRKPSYRQAVDPLSRLLVRLSLPLRRQVLRRRLGRLVLEEVDGVPLAVLPEVFNPVVFRTGAFLARTVAEHCGRGDPAPTWDSHSALRCLDMGTG